MAATDRKTFDADTAERVLDEFRATSPEVEQLFKVHVGQQTAAEVGLDAITTALANLNHTLCLVVERENGTEYLRARDGDEKLEWYSVTEYAHRTLGPLPIYEHNVTDRIARYEIVTAKVSQSPYAGVELPEHDLNEDEVTLDVGRSCDDSQDCV